MTAKDDGAVRGVLATEREVVVPEESAGDGRATTPTAVASQVKSPLSPEPYEATAEGRGRCVLSAPDDPWQQDQYLRCVPLNLHGPTYRRAQARWRHVLRYDLDVDRFRSDAKFDRRPHTVFLRGSAWTASRH
jgi:hypothetical protein